MGRTSGEPARGGRRGPGRRAFLGLAGGLVAAGLPGPAGCAAEPTADHLRVRTDTGPLRERFALLGELSDAHWLGYDVDAAGRRETVPGPDARIRMVGVARPAADTLRAALDSRPDGERFREAPPLGAVPAPLAPYLPERTGWRQNTGYDLLVLGGGEGGAVNDRADGRFLLHEGRGLVWFDAVFLHA
ncbi:hypothetical protein [Streptomyces sp. NPDC101132]|uniref:hypothetical protein n=1 Tax=Streptomyces sp. NPDC101132 TaxID=3366110 RepID=UPI0038272895